MTDSNVTIPVSRYDELIACETVVNQFCDYTKDVEKNKGIFFDTELIKTLLAGLKNTKPVCESTTEADDAVDR